MFQIVSTTDFASTTYIQNASPSNKLEHTEKTRTTGLLFGLPVFPEIYSGRAGLFKDAYKATEWKQFRRTTHTHHPVDDARGNAEALAALKKLGLKI